eukprot:251790-Prorocentrum_minimum.AAC.5
MSVVAFGTALKIAETSNPCLTCALRSIFCYRTSYAYAPSQLREYEGKVQTSETRAHSFGSDAERLAQEKDHATSALESTALELRHAELRSKDFEGKARSLEEQLKDRDRSTAPFQPPSWPSWLLLDWRGSSGALATTGNRRPTVRRRPWLTTGHECICGARRLAELTTANSKHLLSIEKQRDEHREDVERLTAKVTHCCDPPPQIHLLPVPSTTHAHATSKSSMVHLDPRAKTLGIECCSHEHAQRPRAPEALGRPGWSF